MTEMCRHLRIMNSLSFVCLQFYFVFCLCLCVRTCLERQLKRQRQPNEGIITMNSDIYQMLLSKSWLSECLFPVIFFFSLLYCALSVLALSLVELTCAQHSNKYFNSRGMTSNKCQHVRVTGDTTQQNWWKDARYVFIFFFNFSLDSNIVCFDNDRHHFVNSLNELIAVRDFCRCCCFCFVWPKAVDSMTATNDDDLPTVIVRAKKETKTAKWKVLANEKNEITFSLLVWMRLCQIPTKLKETNINFHQKKKIIIKTKSFFSVISAWIT